MIPYSRPKRSDLYTLSQSKLLENHTLHSGTDLYNQYMAVPQGGFRLPLFKLIPFSFESAAFESQIKRPEKMCLSLQHQNQSKTSKKWVILIALQFRYTFCYFTLVVIICFTDR